MLHHFHDKEPAGEQIEQMINNNAAMEMLMKSSDSQDAEAQKQQINPTGKVKLFIILAILYLAVAIYRVYERKSFVLIGWNIFAVVVFLVFGISQYICNRKGEKGKKIMKIVSIVELILAIIAFIVTILISQIL